MDQDTLLIVEEDILIRYPLAQYLRDCGFKVVEASGPDDARVLIGDDAFHVDVLLVSASEGTPDFGFVQWVRENRPGVEVMLAGTVNGAVKKAGDLCADRPGPARPEYDHKAVEDRIRRYLAERTRGNGVERQ